jgi:hypothetical protein
VGASLTGLLAEHGDATYREVLRVPAPSSPADKSLPVRTLQAALDDYDDDQRWGALR